MTAVTLGDISAFITKGATPTTYGFKWEASGVPFLRSECVAEHGLDMRQSMFISPQAHQALRRSQVQDGDILMTITGYVGRVIRLSGIGSANINQHIARIRVKDRRFDSGYIYHYLSQRTMREYYETIVTGQAYPQISLSQVRETAIPAVTLAEQRRIASALDHADELIGSLERLITKKQAIKQGLMQQLLTGSSRLPGREGEFTERRLAGVAVKIQDGTHFSTTLGGSEYRYITSRNIGSGEMRLDHVETISAAEHMKIYARCDPKFGDLLLTKDGANTGNVALNPFREQISLLSSVAFIRCDPRVAIEGYLLQYLLSYRGRRQIQDAMAGNAITRLTLAKIRNLTVPLPGIEEQSAIARVLGDADREIAVLRARLNKARAIKMGMMQQLLTGRVRLPVETAS